MIKNVTSDLIERELAKDLNFDFTHVLDQIQYRSKLSRNTISYMHDSEIITVCGDNALKKARHKIAKNSCAYE